MELVGTQESWTLRHPQVIYTYSSVYSVIYNHLYCGTSVLKLRLQNRHWNSGCKFTKHLTTGCETVPYNSDRG